VLFSKFSAVEKISDGRQKKISPFTVRAADYFFGLEP
jgi:hypothetical protein